MLKRRSLWQRQSKKASCASSEPFLSPLCKRPRTCDETSRPSTADASVWFVPLSSGASLRNFMLHTGT